MWTQRTGTSRKCQATTSNGIAINSKASIVIRKQHAEHTGGNRDVDSLGGGTMPQMIMCFDKKRRHLEPWLTHRR